MIVARRTTVVGNPAKRRSVAHRPKKQKKKKANHVRRQSKGNPAYLMVLGPANPKRSSASMAKKKSKKKAAGHRHHAVARANHKKTKNSRRGVSKAQVKAYMKKHGIGKKRHTASNPFAKSISLGRASDVVTAAAGVLVGVFLNKTLVGFLPASILANPLYATLAAAGGAVLEWWVLSMVQAEFGAAVGLGALAEAASIALTNYLPSVGGSLSLSGRGVGDFVPGRFAVPQNPVLDAATGMPKMQSMAVSAYPAAYKVH